MAGVGGVGLRPFVSNLQAKPWWASAHATDVSISDIFCCNILLCDLFFFFSLTISVTQTGLLDGALFCKLNLNGQLNRGYCYFKQVCFSSYRLPLFSVPCLLRGFFLSLDICAQSQRDGAIRDSFFVESQVSTSRSSYPNIKKFQVNSGADDVEDANCASTDLELMVDGANTQQIVAVRYKEASTNSLFEFVESVLH